MINQLTALDLYKYILISIPLISSMTCGIIFIVVFPKSLSITKNKIRQTLGSYYILMTLLWFITNISIENNKGMLVLVPFFFLLIHLTQVVFYHFICYIVPTKALFNSFYYKITVAIFIMASILVYVLYTLDTTAGFSISAFFYQYLYIYTSLNMMYYTTLCWIRLYTYKREKYKMQFKKIRFSWVSALLVLKTLFSVLFIFNHHRIVLLDTFIVLLIAIQQLVMVFNILQKDILEKIKAEYKTNILVSSGQIISVDNKGLVENVSVNASYYAQEIGASGLLSQHDFLVYFSTKKPYLNKDFKLDDLVKLFGVNRSYISKFVNVTFHSNVSQYINQWRIKEVEELHKTKGELPLEDLVLMAGFSNLRHYLRAKQSFEQKNQKP
ncbi:AraC family transcriptional regulator [Myroides odoratus]|uniref:helix-turn-helix domain-containing protein n=1 Tax=Myroides odoratus TaxID=256 RepID=UPI0033426E3A